MRVFLDLQIARLDDLSRPSWKKSKVKLQTATLAAEGEEPRPVFLVARSGDDALIYDDAVEKWARGAVDEGAVIRSIEHFGEELGFAMRHLDRRNQSANSGKGDE